jgi:ATP-binding cassette subfamily B protein
MKKILNFKEKSNLLKISFLILFSFLGVALYYLIPYFTKYLIDDLIMEQNLNSIKIWIIITVIFSVGLHIYTFYFQKYLWDKIPVQLSNKIRKKIIKKVLNIKKHDYKNIDKGELLNIILQDSSNYSNVFVTYYATGINSILRIIFGYIILLLISPELTIISLLFIPFYILSMVINRKKLEKYSLSERLAADQFILMANKIIEGKTPINLNNKDNFFLKKFEDKKNNWQNERIKYSYWYNFTVEIPNFLSTISTFLVLGVGSYQVIQNQLSLGSLVMFSQYSTMLFEPLHHIVQAVIQKKANKPILKRVNDFYNRTNEDIDFENTDKLIEIRNYNVINEADKILYKIENLIIENKPGLYLIKGDNGSGKSTFFNLISKINDYRENQDKNEYIFKINKEVSKNLSYQGNQIFIFEGTVKENIIFGDEEENYENIESLLNISNSSKFIDMKNIGLSLGEKQKINLARIFNQSEKEIILFDEPTNNLDKKTKEKLVEKIMELKKDKIIFVISHLDNFDKIADKKYEIKNNKLLEY